MPRWVRLGLAAAIAPMLFLGFFARPSSVSAAGCNQWTGAGTTANWSEAANWTLGVPVNGQALCFPGTPGGGALNDDITGLSVTGLDFQALPVHPIIGKSLSVANSITGGLFVQDMSNPIVLSGAVTVHGAFTLEGPISGSGSLDVTQNTLVELKSPNNTFTGGVTVDGPTFGRLAAFSLGTGPITVQSGGELDIESTINNSLSLAGSGLHGYALGCYNGSSFDGLITLAADTTVLNYSAAGPVVAPAHICTIDGVIGGGFKLTLEQLSALAAGLAWDLTAPNTYDGGTAIGGPGHDMGNVIASGSSPLGTGPVTIEDGTGQHPNSALHATGKVGAVTLDAPHGSLGADDGFGNPGTLTVDRLTLTSGVLVSQLASVTAYSTVDSIGRVTIGQATLQVDLGGFQPALGSAFTLIRNDSGVPVTGTFAGLPEGAVFAAANGSNFAITYNGNGRGDVVITAVASVSVPPTGTSLSAGLSVFASGVVLLLLSIPSSRRPRRAR
jgi:fibronectin-binding autotransporter adhesin